MACIAFDRLVSILDTFRGSFGPRININWDDSREPLPKWALHQWNNAHQIFNLRKNTAGDKADMFSLLKEVIAQDGLKHEETKHYIPKKVMVYKA